MESASKSGTRSCREPSDPMEMTPVEPLHHMGFPHQCFQGSLIVNGLNSRRKLAYESVSCNQVGHEGYSFGKPCWLSGRWVETTGQNPSREKWQSIVGSSWGLPLGEKSGSQNSILQTGQQLCHKEERDVCLQQVTPSRKPPQIMPITDLMGETKHSTPTPPHYLCCRWGLQVTDSEMDPEGWPLWKSWKRDQLGRAEVH